MALVLCLNIQAHGWGCTIINNNNNILVGAGVAITPG